MKPVFIEGLPAYLLKNPCVNGPAKFKLMLFKGQLYLKTDLYFFLMFNI